MTEINLFDEEFRHVANDEGAYSLCDGKIPEHIRYVRDQYDWSGVTLFTNKHILSGNYKKVTSKYKIAWILEPREVYPAIYDQFESYYKDFDFCMTFDKELLDKYPDNTKYYPYGGCWIDRNDYGIHPKTKNICMILSNKQDTSGHKLRHQIKSIYNLIEFGSNNIDFYGTGVNKPFDNKVDILKDYRYVIVVENMKYDLCFTEKLLDAISLGCIPIYWGTNDKLLTSRGFNTDGILFFDTIDELDSILKNLDESIDPDVLLHNIDVVKQYDIPDDWIYKNIIEKL